MPDPLGLAVIGDLAQVLQQAAVPGHVQHVEIRPGPAGQRPGIKRRRQRRDPARGQLPDPVLLRLPVIGEMRGAAAAPVPRGLPGRGEPARLIGRPGVPGRAGERLHRGRPHPERPHMIGGQAAQHRRQRPRRRVRHRLRGRQHAQPLVRHHTLQPLGPLHRIPPDERIPHRNPPRRRPERAQHQRHPARLSHVPQHPARRRRPQRMVPGHQRVVPGHLTVRDKADLQLHALICHPALLPHQVSDVRQTYRRRSPSYSPTLAQALGALP